MTRSAYIEISAKSSPERYLYSSYRKPVAYALSPWNGRVVNVSCEFSIFTDGRAVEPCMQYRCTATGLSLLYRYLVVVLFHSLLRYTPPQSPL
jgi:hypothetical protein